MLPLRHLGQLYAPDTSQLRIYRSKGSRSALPLALDHLVYPRSGAGVLTLLVLALLGAALLARRRLDELAIVPAALLISTLPVALMVWNADRVELDRHLYGGAVMTRLAILVLGCLIAEAVLEPARLPRVVRAQLRRANVTG